MNFIGIVALIINLIGVIIVGIGLYYMYQDVNSTSTRSTFWTAAGVGILLLGIILMIMAIIFKGNDQKRAKEKVDKRVDVVKKAVVANEMENTRAQQIAAQQAAIAQQQQQQQAGQVRYNECGDVIPEPIIQYVQAPAQPQPAKEYIYVAPDFLAGTQPVIVEAGKTYEDKKQDKEIKRINRSLEELGKKLEGNGNRDREREIAKNYKMQKKEQEMKIEALRNELNTVRAQQNNKIEEKKIEKRVEKRMAKQGIIPPRGTMVVGGEIVPKHMYQTPRMENVVPHPLAVQQVNPNMPMYQQTLRPPVPYPANHQLVNNQYGVDGFGNQLAGAIAANIPAFQQMAMDPRFVQANANLVGNALEGIGALAGQFNQGRAQPLTSKSPFLGQPNRPSLVEGVQPFAQPIIESPSPSPQMMQQQYPTGQVPQYPTGQVPQYQPAGQPTGQVPQFQQFQPRLQATGEIPQIANEAANQGGVIPPSLMQQRMSVPVEKKMTEVLRSPLHT